VLTEFGVTIAPSTYYAALTRPKSRREVRDEELMVEVQRVYDENYRVYGARKIWRQLRRDGVKVGRGRVERLMRRLGISGVVRGKTVRTTVSDKDGVRAADLVKRQFTAGAPNRLWVADFTYVATWAGTVYVAFAIDVFSRKIVGWRASMSKETDLVLDAIDMGLRQRDYCHVDSEDKLVHHSDAGSQYTSFRFTQHLIDAGIDASIGTVGDAYDNALAESTIGLYKTELIKPHGPWHNKNEVEIATAAWVEWYNDRRLHEACGYRLPATDRVRDPVRARRPDQSGRLTPVTSLYQTRGGSVLPFSRSLTRHCPGSRSSSRMPSAPPRRHAVLVWRRSSRASRTASLPLMRAVALICSNSHPLRARRELGRMRPSAMARL